MVTLVTAGLAGNIMHLPVSPLSAVPVSLDSDFFAIHQFIVSTIVVTSTNWLQELLASHLLYI